MNAFPGYAFAGTAKTDPGFVIAYVDIGPSGASFSVEIESESAERNPTRYAVDNSRDDAATAEDFVATHGAKIFRNHLISVMAEEGRLVFRVAP